MADERHHRRPENYPKSFFFMMGVEVCERFNYYALRGILSVYLTEVLLYDERGARIIYHLFSAAICIMPLFGAMVASSLGRYGTMLCLSCVYAAGNTALAVVAIKSLKLQGLELLALGLVAVGAGGIRPCSVTFAADQFVLPKQQHEKDAYFHLFYLALDVGSLISLLITPILSKHISCFGEDTCYPLAFFLPAALMFIAIAIFRGGRSLYRIVHAEGHTLHSFISCVCIAAERKLVMQEVQKDHWLDFAIEEHGEDLVSDAKAMMHLLIIFLPLPIFWALFEQQATSWIFQARQLNGDLGRYLTILPEHMQFVNPAMILIFVPLFDHVIYPFFAHFGKLRTPLQRMVTGGALAAIAFALTAILQFDIENSDIKPLSPRVATVRFFNVFNCKIGMRSKILDGEGTEVPIYSLSEMGSMIAFVKHYDDEYFAISYLGDNKCNFVDGKATGDLPNRTKQLSCYSYRYNVSSWCELEDATKLPRGNTRVRVIVNLSRIPQKQILIKFFNSGGSFYRQLFSSDMSYNYVAPGAYGVEFGCSPRYYVVFPVGGIYTLAAFAEWGDRYSIKIYEIYTRTTYLHMKRMIPQYALMSAAEVLLVFSGLELAYMEAPKSMTAIVQPLWLLANAVGQIIVVIIEVVNIYDRDVFTYILYAVMMLLDVFLFVWISVSFFTYQNFKKE